MKIILFLIITLFNYLPIQLHAQEESTPSVLSTIPSTAKESLQKKSSKKKKQLIRFNFENEDLVNIINMIAAKRKENIILPQGVNAIKNKLTFKLPYKITLDEAEQYVNTFLELAGYTKVPHNNVFMIVKNDPNITRENLDFYINVRPQDLPNTNNRIRAIYYLQTLKVPEAQQANADPITIMLNDMLSPQKSLLYDSKSNAIIIADSANNISSAMTIILELDTVGSREVIEMIPLYNSTATIIADILNKQVIAIGTQQGALKSDVKGESGLYFSPNTRIIADARTNSIILMGREPAVERLKEFINEYLDIPLESGESILHVYDLQFLDAETFAQTLQNIIKPQGASDQTTQKVTGPQRFFEGVIVVPESSKAVSEAQKIIGATAPTTATSTTAGATTPGPVYQGGNRIIVAASKEDWNRIVELIRQLDRPQPQVIIEVMIVDLTIQKSKILGSQMRNPHGIPLPPGMTFQSAQLGINSTQGVIYDVDANGLPTTISGDLLRLFPATSTAPTQSLAEFLTNASSGNPGSMIISLNDPTSPQSGIWTVFQVLNSYTDAKILSHPFIVTLNNKQALEKISTIRRQRGSVQTGEGAVSSVTQEDLPATLEVRVTPRISSTERLNLQLTITINDFLNATSFTRLTREIVTNANINTGQILVLGGLTQLRNSENSFETPLLSKIPLIGWLFRNNAKVDDKTNLAVFICPTIIEPKLRAGLDRYTADKIDKGYNELNEGVVFDNLKDPITRIFFNQADNQSEEMLDIYLADVTASNLVRDKSTEENIERLRHLLSKDTKALNSCGSKG